jgi:hypothetical protein
MVYENALLSSTHRTKMYDVFIDDGIYQSQKHKKVWYGRGRDQPPSFQLTLFVAFLHDG